MEHRRQAVQHVMNEWLRCRMPSASLQRAWPGRMKSLNREVLASKNRAKESHILMKRVTGLCYQVYDMDNIKFELKQMEEVTAAEIAEKDYKLERAERDIAERKESAYVARDER